MEKLTKRIVFLILTVLFVLAAAFSVSAAEDLGEPTYSGTCGTNTVWALYANGDFVVEGSGSVSEVPWKNLTLNIKRVRIGDEVTNVPAEAFLSCPSLTEVVLGRGVETLGKRAFSNCGALKTVTVSDRLDFSDTTNSQWHPFDRSSPERIIVPATVTFITPNLYNLGSIAVFECGGRADGAAEWYFDDGGVLYYENALNPQKKLVKYPHNMLIDGNAYTVLPGTTAIGSYAMYDKPSLESISFAEAADTLVTIEGYAFAGCTGLTTVVIPDHVTAVGGYAFENCSALEEVVFGHGVQTLGQRAFSACKSLKTITVSDNLTLKDDPTSQWYAFDGCAPETIVIPATVTQVPPNLYNMSSLRFFDCEADMNYFESDVWYFDDDGVLYCYDNLTGKQTLVRFPHSRTFGNRARSYEILEETNIIGEKAFYDIRTMKAVSFEKTADALETIKANAFSRCEALTAVEIPDRVTSIGASAFASCSGLESVVLGRGVKTLGQLAFSGCGALKTVTVSDRLDFSDTTNSQWHPFYQSSPERIIVPATVTFITPNLYNFGSIAVFECGGRADGAAEWYFDDGGVLYYGNALTNTQKLVKYPRGMLVEGNAYTVLSGTNTVGAYAFHNKPALESISFEKTADTLITIEDYAFAGCTGLKTVVIPDHVTAVRGYAFENCSALESVVFGRGVETLGQRSFSACKSLKTITVSDNLTLRDDPTSQWYSFQGSAPETVIVPSTVTSVPENLYVLPSIKEFVCEAGPDHGNRWYFDEDGILYFRNEQTGEQTLVICPRAKVVESHSVVSGTKTVQNGAFSSIASLKEIVFPKSLAKIGSSAFKGCAALEKAYFFGSAPSVTAGSAASPSFMADTVTLYYIRGRSGWTEGTWNGYRTAVFEAENTITLRDSSDYAISGDGGSVTFVKAKTDVETFLMNFLDADLVLYDADGNPLGDSYAGYVGTGFTLAAVDGNGTVTDSMTVIIFGELNGDGEIDASDRMLLVRYLADRTGFEGKLADPAAADANGDGQSNGLDRLILARYLAHWEGYETYFE